MSTRLQFTSNPALVILLGAVIVVAGYGFGMAFRMEKLSPLLTLLSGLIPGLILVFITARASIHLRQVQSQLESVRVSLAANRPLVASLLQSVTADGVNLGSLHAAVQSSVRENDRDLSDRVMNTAINFEHTYSIAQRLSVAISQIDVSLNPAVHAVDRPSAQARLESQHQTPTVIKLRTLPNGSLDRSQLVELR